MEQRYIKPKFRSSRQLKRASYRRMYGNPWDSPITSPISSPISSPRRSSPQSSIATRKNLKSMLPKKSAFKRKSTSRKSVKFREPLERSKSKTNSTTSSSHAAWHSVPSKSM